MDPSASAFPASYQHSLQQGWAAQPQMYMQLPAYATHQNSAGATASHQQPLPAHHQQPTGFGHAQSSWADPATSSYAAPAAPAANFQPPLPEEPPPLPPDDPPDEPPPLPPEDAPLGAQTASQDLSAHKLLQPTLSAASQGWPAQQPWQHSLYGAQGYHHYANAYHQYQSTYMPAYGPSQWAPSSAASHAHPWQPQHPWQQPQAAPLQQAVPALPPAEDAQAVRALLYAVLDRVKVSDTQPERSPTPPAMTIVSAVDLFLPPGRATRPKKIVIIMRGLPGSGKTHMSRMLRELETQHSADAPRIHGIDDYFVTEVEKDIAVPNAKGKRQHVREMEYCFEPELEGRYKQSLLKAYRRTVEEGRFKMVIVDAPNICVADFKEYWSLGQRGGYEVFVMRPIATDPKVCFGQNVHSRTLDDIQGMAAAWEPTPLAYPQLDVAPLLKPQLKKEQADIAEVDMDMEEDAGAAHRPPTEEADEVAPAGLTSRWLNGEHSPVSAAPVRSKKARRAAREPSPAQALQSKLVHPKSILRTGARSSKGSRAVTWPDQADQEAGFSVGGPLRHQLETVYVLEGLGPPHADGSTAPFQGPSFADQAKKDRASEQQLFRSLLLGGSRPSKPSHA